MRPANASLIAFLQTRRPYVKADLFTITLANGTVYNWTSFDKNLTIGGVTFSALGPVIDRSKWGVKNVIDVPEMEIRIYSTGADMPDGSNLKLAVHNGLFDYSTVLLSRVIMPVVGDVSLGVVDIFLGNTAEVKVDDVSITLTAKGANHTLAQYMPRNQYVQSCIHSLYDEGCAPNPGVAGGGPSRAAYTVPNTVGAGSTTRFITFGGTVPANVGNFALGYITFTSGANQGQTTGVNASSSSGLALAYPLYSAPTAGDSFNLTYGCDHTRGANGCAFFNNLGHYRGFPYIPPAEFAV